MKSSNFAKRQSRSVGSITATEHVLASLATNVARFGASLALITAVSLIVGYVAADSYYRHLGAPWIVGLMSTGQLVAFGGKVTLGVAFAAMAAIWYILDREVGWFHLYGIRTALFGLSAVAAFPVLAQFAWVTPTIAYYAMVTSSIFAAAAFGAAIGELVVHLTKSNLRWQQAHLALVLLIFFYGLIQAPRGFALGAALRDTNFATSEFEIVETEDVLPPERAWRLVAVFEKSAILVSLASNPKQRVFRFVTIEEMRRIMSHKDAG